MGLAEFSGHIKVRLEKDNAILAPSRGKNGLQWEIFMYLLTIQDVWINIDQYGTITGPTIDWCMPHYITICIYIYICVFMHNTLLAFFWWFGACFISSLGRRITIIPWLRGEAFEHRIREADSFQQLWLWGEASPTTVGFVGWSWMSLPWGWNMMINQG